MILRTLTTALALGTFARTQGREPEATPGNRLQNFNDEVCNLRANSFNHLNNICPLNITPLENTKHEKPQLAIDGDWGGDELMTLSLLLAHAKEPISMVSAVSGNAGCDKTSKNMVDITGYLNATDIPAFPCFEKNTAFDGAHGNDGIGGIQLPPTHHQPEPEPAVNGLEKLLKNAGPNSIVLFATGPLTNIDNVLKQHPEHANKIRSLIVMGGSLKDMPSPTGPRRGNITPHSEFNFYSDPEAAAGVLSALKEKVTLFPMDCTHQLTFTPEHQQRLADTNIPRQTQFLLQQLLSVPGDMDMKKFGLHPTLHDLHVALYYLFPDLYTVERGGVCITTQGDERGKTTHCENGPTTHYATKLNAPDAAYDHLLRSFEKHFGSRLN